MHLKSLRAERYETRRYRKGLMGNVGATLASDLEQEAATELVSYLSQTAAWHRNR
jgi:hypothetical protein